MEASHDLELHAYNAAFYELGLRWHWDADLYGQLRAIPVGQERVRAYLENHQPHLLKAYDADFLSNLIEGRRARLQETLCDTRKNGCSPHSWANARMNEIGH